MVLGVVLLVLLILGFSVGWQNLWERISIFTGGTSIESVIIACQTAAATNQDYSFCSDLKKVKIAGKAEYVNCEDSRVSVSLESRLDCTNQKDNLKKECEALNSSGSVTINGNLVTSCDSL